MRALALALLVFVAPATGAGDDSGEKHSGSALINHGVRAKWADLGAKPAGRADDAEFVRRAFLDIVGVIPSIEEIEKFLQDRSSGKRAKLVDTLLADARYAEHWADVWSGILVGFDSDRREQAYRFRATADLREMLRKNMPYDEFARKIITMQGQLTEYGPMEMMAGKKEGEDKEAGLVSYVVKIFREAQRDTPLAMAGKLTRAFMGVQVQCAQCHDHPFDKWTQEEFYGMASFFSEVRVRRERMPDGKQGPYIVQDADPKRGGAMRDRFMMGGGDLRIPDSKTGPIKAAFLETGKGAEPGVARRETFAKYMTSPGNLQFARMAVNRYWAHFFGEGMVNPPDDFNGKNKPTHPELLDGLAQDFIAHKFDLRWLIAAIANSEPYHLTSRAATREPAAEKYLAFARVRALSPEQIMKSVLEATGLDEVGRALAARAGEGMRDRMVAGMTSQFRFAFGDDEGSEVVEFSGTIPSALLMMNGESVWGSGPGAGMGRGGEGPRRQGPMLDRFRGGSMASRRLEDLLSRYKSAEEKIRVIYLSVLSRLPAPKEEARWKAHVGGGNGVSRYEDLQWTLVNTSEFLFNH